MTAVPARPARRRGAELEHAIEEAVVALVVEQGATAVTMEAVAARCGTSKPVLYRRWPDRAALLRDVLLRRATGAILAEDTGSYRTDMLAIMRGWASVLSGPGSRVMQAIVAATTNAADLLGLAKEVGSIEPGKSADIIAVSGDPLKDVRVLKSVGFVMRAGVVHRQ